MPEISVIIAARNAQSTIGGALDSILAQTFGDFEAIVVDDESSDSTARVAMEHPLRPTVLRNDRRLGRGGSRNRAIAVATGKFLAIHDADDWSDPQRLELTATHAREQGLVVCGGQLLNLDRGGRYWEMRSLPLDDNEIREQLVSGMMACAHPASLIDREVFLDVGGYDPRLERAQDLQLFRRLLGHGRFGNVPEVVVFYRHDWFLPWGQWHRNREWHNAAMSLEIDGHLGEVKERRRPLRWAASNTRRFVQFRRTATTGGES